MKGASVALRIKHASQKKLTDPITSDRYGGCEILTRMLTVHTTESRIAAAIQSTVLPALDALAVHSTSSLRGI